GDDAADQHEEDDRQLAEEVVDAEVEVRLRQVEDQPALRLCLNPGADGGAERGEPEDPEIAMGEGARDPIGPRAGLFDRFRRARGRQEARSYDTRFNGFSG